MEEGRLLKQMPRRIPVNGTFELTVRCNLHCKMCLFRHVDCENEQLQKEELTAAEWIQMAKNAAALGTLQLLITGGEPMLRPDFCEIWEGIYRQGFLIELYTNATMVTPRILETLKRYPPHRIGITVYGASKETYEAVCGQGAAFERMVEGVRMLQTLPSVIEFRTTIIQENVAEVEGIEQLVRREFGHSRLVSHTNFVAKAVRGGCMDVEACRLGPEKSVDVLVSRTKTSLERLLQCEDAGRKYRLAYRKPEETEETERMPRRLTLLGCDAGMSSYTVAWDGKLLGCQMLGAFHTDARQMGLEEAWEQFPACVNVGTIPETCRDCSLLSVCEQCPAVLYAETGSVNGVSEYICRKTKYQDRLIREGGRLSYEKSV